MVNFGLNSEYPGYLLAGGRAVFLRSRSRAIARSHDFAAMGLLCGFILLFQGWRLDPFYNLVSSS